jgi:hypothetical protein
MAAKLLLLVAACAFAPACATEQASQWKSLMKAWHTVQPPAGAALEESALEEAALKDAEKEIGGLDDTTPKAVHQSHLRTVASKPPAASKPVATLERAITDMMLGKGEGAAAFAATPFGDSVQKIINLIDKEMFPKVIEGHKLNQKELDELAAELKKCDSTRKLNIAISDKSKAKYLKLGPLHRTCRDGEAGKSVEKTECYKELSDRKTVMDLKCKEYSMVDNKVGDQNANSQIVKRAGGESTETYVKRLSDTICPPGGGGPPPGRGGRPACKKMWRSWVWFRVHFHVREECLRQSNQRIPGSQGTV